MITPDERVKLRVKAECLIADRNRFDSIAHHMEAEAEYLAVATPETVIAMLDQIDELEFEVRGRGADDA